jgi:catechol 2,3-dioxygenase-like lactoylglutathione lyase family enzyme
MTGARRRLAGFVCWSGAVLAALAAQDERAARPAVTGLAIPVRDLDASLRFYGEVLRCHVESRRQADGAAEEARHALFAAHTRSAVLRLGDERLELVEFVTPRGRALPEDSRSNDRWFQHAAIVVRDMDAAYAELVRHRVRHASPRPQTLPASNPVAGGIRAFYFHDPDGHALELLWFPPGKGDAKWQRGGDELFLGIDHTAIVVADTDASLRFWRDELGLAVVGASDNHGEEQERLNAVFGARLRITTLRGASGPGVELLEYVTPRGGRALPADTVASDLWHWVVTVTGPAARLQAPSAASGGAAVAPRAVEVGGTAEWLVRDADGHRVRLTAAR